MKEKRVKPKIFFENHKNIIKIGIPYKKKLFEKNSKYQNVKVIETEGFGNMLINDNIVMTCERDEFVYHEMITHVPLFSHPHPKDVLIIGGGDGGTAREALKHKNIKCTMVEIDSLVITACKKHLKKTACSFNNPKLNLQVEDGANFIKKFSSAFDVILVDSSDPVGPSSVLFGNTFYNNVFKALKKEGILIAQAGNSFYDLNNQKSALKICKKLFKRAGFYNYSNLTYPAGPWSFLFASKGVHPVKNFKPERVKKSKIKFRYYNPDIHISSFSQPEFVKKAFGSLWTL
ncbi:MAG: polyamine aminopropyltransferase [Oligoflexia bacterium]|nr:polyamine aminopropyltransferase [Oligoflexia bacterium]